MKYLRAVTAAGLGVLTLVSCGSNNDDSSTIVETSIPEGPTWYADIQPIIGVHCQGCHSETEEFTFPLTDYETISSLAPVLLDKMEGSSEPPYLMPPFAHVASDECEDLGLWRDDLRLSEEQLILFGEWIDAGTPEGDPSTEVEYLIPETDKLEGEGIVRYSTSGATIEAGVYEDQYICFSVDPELDEDGWFDGIEVHPGNNNIVHHVVVFTDPEGESEALGGESGSYPCFGGAKVSNSSVAYAWAPGSQPLSLVEDSGTYLKEGGRLVVQMHYHPNGNEETDQTELSIRWPSQTPSRWAGMFVYGAVAESHADSNHWVDPPFLVPEGATEHTEVWEEVLVVPEGFDVRLWGIFPHMHLAGTGINIRIERGDDEEICLNNIPAWDFEWQRSYLLEGTYEELPRVYDGDKLIITCTYNNSPSNPTLMDYLDEEELADIVVGEESFDEMCTAILGVVLKL